MYRVELAPAPRTFYADADHPLAKKLARCFSQLEVDPRRHNNIKALRGDLSGLYRFRIGDWRVIYRIDEKHSSVRVLAIAHRSEVYE
jgi:mRNA interferase RelE/StbE